MLIMFLCYNLFFKKRSGDCIVRTLIFFCLSIVSGLLLIVNHLYIWWILMAINDDVEVAETLHYIIIKLHPHYSISTNMI